MNLVGETWMWWAGAFAVGVPVLLVALTEILGHLTRRKNPAAGPVRLVRNWVVPVGALLALLAFAIHSPTDQVWIRVVATIFGFLVILLILSAFNVALFANAKSGSWRERVPTIFVEIVRLLLVVIGLALLFSWVWGADVGGLIAALGVTSIIIGLALQNAVGGVVSGLRVGVEPGVGRFGGAVGAVSHSFSTHEGVEVGVFDGVGVGVALGVSDGVGVGVAGGVAGGVLVLAEGDGVVFGGLHLPSLSRPLSSTHGGVSTTPRGGVLLGDFGLRGTPLSHWNPHSSRKRQVFPSLVWTVNTLYASGRSTSSGVTRGMPSSPTSM